jgi:succinate dehydrogenase/fumarate reductase cytochrome b subunit
MQNENILETKDWIKNLSTIQKIGIGLIALVILIHFIFTIRFLLG